MKYKYLSIESDDGSVRVDIRKTRYFPSRQNIIEDAELNIENGILTISGERVLFRFKNSDLNYIPLDRFYYGQCREVKVKGWRRIFGKVVRVYRNVKYIRMMAKEKYFIISSNFRIIG